MIKNFCLLIFLCVFSFALTAQQDTTRLTNSLKDDAYLHPIDCIGPYTLQKGEWIYAQSVQTLPFPSWAFVGITDKLTAQVDLLPWIFGAFSELKRPIPSVNFRYRFNKQKGALPTIGVEAMFVHFWDTLQRFDSPTLTVWQNGSYLHLKPVMAYRFGDDWNVNLSGGVDYVGEVIMQNNDSTKLQTKTFENSWNPNFSVGVDYRPSDWISYHMGFSYGSTLTYLENVPRKTQVNYGFRVAPFWKSKRSFFRDFRIELVAINAFFTDIEAQQIFPIPIFPYFYWQWTNKHRRER